MNEKLTVDPSKPMPGVYIGDPCYILPNDFYQEFWGNEHNWEDGALCAKDGRPVMIVCGTMYGDGKYAGTVRNLETGETRSHYFPVDAGVLAVVNLEFADPKKVADVRESPNTGLGVVVDIPCTDICLKSNENGEFFFSVLKAAESGPRDTVYTANIETGDYPEDDEDYEGDYEWYEWEEEDDEWI